LRTLGFVLASSNDCSSWDFGGTCSVLLAKTCVNEISCRLVRMSNKLEHM
jgi:hypothetical protein